MNCFMAHTYKMASELIETTTEGSVTTHKLGAPIHAVDEDGKVPCGAQVSHVIANSHHASVDDAAKCPECATHTQG